MRIWKGVKKRGPASHWKLQSLSSFLLAATLRRQILNLQNPGKDYSPSHFLLDVRIFNNSAENEASLITPFTDFLDFANHWKPRNYLLSHSAFLLNVSDFTDWIFSIQKWQGWWCVWPHCFQRCSISSDICSFTSLADWAWFCTRLATGTAMGHNPGNVSQPLWKSQLWAMPAFGQLLCTPLEIYSRVLVC